MNPLTAIVLVVCIAFSTAQNAGDQMLGSPDSTGAAAGSPGSTGSAAASSGALTPTTITGGPLDNAPRPVAATTANNAAGANHVNQLFRNPLMNLGLTGGDNLLRAVMVPHLSRFGNTASYYWLSGGIDKFFSAVMSDIMNRILARSLGMNPAMTGFLTGQIVDSPDNYAVSNMIFNGMGGRANTAPMSSSVRSQNALPTGAASSRQGSPNSIFGSPNSIFGFSPILASMALM